MRRPKYEALVRKRERLVLVREGLRVARDVQRPGGTSGPFPIRSRYLELEQKLKKIEGQLTAVDRQIAEVERIKADRRPARQELLRKVIEACEAVCALGSAIEAYDAETGRLTGLAPAAHPAPALLPGGAVRYQVEQLRRRLSPREERGEGNALDMGHRTPPGEADSLHCDDPAPATP